MNDKTFWWGLGVVSLAIIVGVVTVQYVIPRQISMESPYAPQTLPTNSQALDTPHAYDIEVSTIKYADDAQGYFARPSIAGSYPGVVMIHENRGLRPEIKDTAEQLAKAGYQVLAVDLYKGQVVEDQTQARALSQGFVQEEGTANMQAAAAFLRGQGATRIASLGWCFGGRQSLELAMSGERLDATVVYYGGGMATTVDKLKPITWPVLGIFGDQDTAIPLTMVEEFKASLTSLGVPNEVHIYPGVGHAFANPSGANYAPEATKDAWEKTLEFLDRTLKS